VLHITARNLRRQGAEEVPARPVLGRTNAGSWGAYPAENWVVLTRAQWQKLLPAQPVAAGASWDIDKEAATPIFTYFYPATENNNPAKNRIDEFTLRATVVSVENGLVRARLDGRLRMKHPFYHKDDNNFAEAAYVGYLDFDAAKKEIRDLQLATRKATYGGRIFGVVGRVAGKGE
jgi:hypothetical protein